MKNGHIMMKLCGTLFFIGLMIVASSDSRSNEATMLSSESFRKNAENSIEKSCFDILFVVKSQQHLISYFLIFLNPVFSKLIGIEFL